MKKYFFFDIDGTLIPETEAHIIPEEVQEALEQLQKNGHFCAIASGRANCEAEPVRKSLGFANMVCDGGNGIVLEGELVSLEPLPRDLCLQLAEECDREGIHWALSPENQCYMIVNHEDFPVSNYLERRVKEDLNAEDYDQIYKMYLDFPPGEEYKLPALERLDWCRYDDCPYVFVEPANKAHGIRKIMDYFQASYEDVVVFGDGKNDLSMFMDEWFCIAMGNAVPELKEKADFITLDADKGGVPYALKHFKWI